MANGGFMPCLRPDYYVFCNKDFISGLSGNTNNLQDDTQFLITSRKFIAKSQKNTIFV
jgi:hypothetical protein